MEGKENGDRPPTIFGLKVALVSVPGVLSRGYCPDTVVRLPVEAWLRNDSAQAVHTLGLLSPSSSIKMAPAKGRRCSAAGKMIKGKLSCPLVDRMILSTHNHYIGILPRK